jgi:hypothetical protein
MMKSIDEFVAENNISCLADIVETNPRFIVFPITGGGLGETRAWTHWRAVLKKKRAGRSTFTVYFSRRGSATTSPTAAEIIDSLAIDALVAENPDKSELGSELGIDLDATTKYISVCNKRREGLKRVLGPGAYQSLLYETHRIIK